MAEGQMPDHVETPPVGDKPAEKLAGKYDTAEALEEGFKNLHKLVDGNEWDPKVKVLGDDGVFSTPKDLETAYKMLDSARGKITAAKPAAGDGIEIKPSDKPPAPTGPELRGDAKVLKAAGLDAKDLAEQWAKDGKLTEEQYKAFEKQGRDRDEVNARFQGEMARAQLQVQAVERAKEAAVKVAGGKDELQTLRDAAADRADTDPEFRARLERWNKRADPSLGGDISEYPDMVDWLAREHAKHTGTDKSAPLVKGGTPSTSTTKGAKDGKEFEQLMRRANNGDEAAMLRIQATTQEEINSWGR